MPELRNITSDEFERGMSTEPRVHWNRLAHEPEHLRCRFNLGRSITAFEDRQVAGRGNAPLLEISMPGGTPIADGISNVDVQP